MCVAETPIAMDVAQKKVDVGEKSAACETGDMTLAVKHTVVCVMYT